jgi:hypothetical protein
MTYKISWEWLKTCQSISSTNSLSMFLFLRIYTKTEFGCRRYLSLSAGVLASSMSLLRSLFPKTVVPFRNRGPFLVTVNGRNHDPEISSGHNRAPVFVLFLGVLSLAIAQIEQELCFRKRVSNYRLDGLFEKCK